MKRVFLVLSVILLSVAMAPVSSNLCNGSSGNGGLWSVDEINGKYFIVTSDAQGNWTSEKVTQVEARSYCHQNE